MKKILVSALAAGRRYKAGMANNKAYRTGRYVVGVAATAYVLLLIFPQILFAHEVSYRNLTVHARTPIDQSIAAVLRGVEARLARSDFNDRDVTSHIFIADTHRFYEAISLHVGVRSFAKGFPLLPTNNIFVNRADVARDLVFRRAPAHNARSLSGVIAHELTHVLVRRKLGYLRNLAAPAWKKEGYADYIAGGSTLPDEIGIAMWKARPGDSAGYQHFKYYMLVKYLIEHDKLSASDLFRREFDTDLLEARVLGSL